MHIPAQEAQHRHDARRKARTLHDDHTIPRISAPPARVSDATHNRTITGIITDCLNPLASRADAVWISEGRSHTRAVSCLHNIGMQIRSEFNLNSPNSLRIRSQREFAANSA